MRNHLKKVLKAISIAILAVVLAFTNFAGLFPAKVYAAAQVVRNESAFGGAIMEASTDPGNPTVIRLGNDFMIENDNTVRENRYVILDLNGQTLSLNGRIDVIGSLTVQGSGTLEYVNLTNASIDINGGTFTLSGGTLECNGFTNGVVIHSGSKFVMTGGEINGDGYEPFVSSGEYATIEISGGTITKNGPGAAISSAGTVSITGGTITSIYRSGLAVSITSTGTLTVSGGTLQNTEGGYSLNIENGGQATQTGGTISGSINTNSNGTFNYEGGTNPEHSTITFVANGGSGTMDPQYVQNGVATALTANSFTRDDYSFDGWKDGSGTSYADGATVNINSDMTLTAQWKESSAPTTYTITFDANGGTVSPTSGTTDASGKLSSLPTPTWSGHDFSGWFTAANGGTQVTTNTVFTGSDTIYAHWAGTPPAPGDHTITVTNDGHGTGRTDHATASCDALVQLSATPSSGWIFDRWTTEDAIDIKNPTSATDAWFRMIDSNVTVKANFKAKSNPKKDDDDDDHYEESSSHSPEKPSWTPAKAAATIAAQKAQKQQAAATQLASIQTMLRTKTSDRAGTGRNVIDLDMTKVDILDPATVNLLLLNNRFAFNVKISVPGGLTTTIMIPANFNFRPFIKADGTMNIHEVLWWIISKRR